MDRRKIESFLPDDYVFDDFSETIAEKLCGEFKDLEYVKLKKVAFLRKQVKAKAGRKTKYACCRAVPVPWSAFTDGILWIIETEGENFTNLPLDKKQKVIYHELRHIPNTLDEGKVVKHDVEDFKICVDKFGGANWVVSGDDNLLVEMEDEKKDPLDQGPDEYDDDLDIGK